MPLEPESKQANLETSLTVWLRANLGTAAGLTVFLGMQPSTTRPNQWVQLDYLLGLRHDWGGLIGLHYGGQAHHLLQTSLCLKRDAVTDVYAMARLHDLVAGYLQEGQTIPLRNYGVSGNPLLGAIAVGATTSVDTDTGLESGVIVRVLSTELVSSTAWTVAS